MSSFMYIESDLPIGDVPQPCVTVAVTTAEGQHTSVPLVYETWRRNEHARTVLVRCYDARGASVTIHLPQEIVEEMVFGEVNT